MPCPPNSVGDASPDQPPSTNCAYASLKPGVVVTATVALS
jgi:hypothetical protein